MVSEVSIGGQLAHCRWPYGEAVHDGECTKKKGLFTWWQPGKDMEDRGPNSYSVT